MGRLRTFLLVTVACGSLAACKSSGSSGGDGGAEDDGGGGTGTCTGGVDKSIDPDTAIDLAATKAEKGYVCPQGDQDYYKITVPQGHKLAHIKLTNTAALPVVNLTYLLLDQNKKTVAAAPTITGKVFDVAHCVPGPGTYYLIVKDDGDDARDGKNPYELSYTTEADKDANEDNNTQAASKPAAGGPRTGYISCAKDVDFFDVTVAQDQLLEIKLTTPGPTPVDLKYVIYDANKQKVGEDAVADGQRAATNLTTVHAMPAPGKYFIAIQDAGDDDSDVAVAYTLSLQTRAEQDPQDKGKRNDTVATATVLGADNVDTSITGQIGSKADVDYFKVNGLGDLSENNPGVIEIQVTYNGAALVNPSVELIYGHQGSPCTKDACCSVIKGPKPSCTSSLDCVRYSYNCVAKGDIFCTDNACEANPTSLCATDKMCAGAVACLPDKVCGVQQVVRFDENPKDTTGAMVRTAQPLLHPGPWYIRVSDHKSDAYEYGKNYTLTVKVRRDPDGAKELNSEYFPDVFISPSLTNQVRAMHVAAAKKKNIHISSGAAVTGYISYEGDQDWYVVDNPCTAGDCVLRADFSTGPGCPTGADGKGLEFIYEFRHDDGKVLHSWPKAPAPGKSGCFGNNCDGCFFARSKDKYFLVVTDSGHNNWSWSCSYTISLTVVSQSCTAPCATYQGECYSP
ncbi:MAG: hypothetical protein IT371_01180 [Deltaproteobacteria bacterium]|nr:hypothetical protein [Deltaproteobacteria bacterium]